MHPSPWQRALAPVYRKFFDLLYHEYAWTYDAVAGLVSLGQWQAWVESVLPYLRGPRILELGHGPGHLQRLLQERHLRVVGLDESPQMGRLAYRRLKGSGKNPLLVRGYAQSTPFPNNSFDQIVATFPSEYIYQEQTVREISRLLVPGGEFLLLPVAWISGKRPAQRLAAWLFQVTGQAPSPETARRILQEQDHPSLTNFQKAGFQIEFLPIEHRASVALLIRMSKDR